MAKKKSTRKSAKPKKTAKRKAAPKKKTAKKAARRDLSTWRPVCSRHGVLSNKCMSKQEALELATDHALADPRCEGDAERC